MMLRQVAFRTPRSPASNFSTTLPRTFTTAAARRAAGDTGSGASRSQGLAQGDAFSKREKAAEDMWIQKDEREKLMKLKEKLAQQKKHIDELDKHIDDITREQGGEKN